MKKISIIPFLLICFSAFSQSKPEQHNKDSVKVVPLYVLTLTGEDYVMMLQWIQSSSKHTGGECQDFSDFLKSNTRVIQDTTKNKKPY